MRKLLTLLLALALLTAGTTAWAEETTYLTYTHPERGYTIEYPASMTCSDASGVAEKIDSANVDMGELSEYTENVESTGIVMFNASNGANLNINYTDVGVAITAEQANELVLPSVVEMLKGMMEDLEVTEEPTLREYGDRQYACIQYAYTLQGMPITCAQYYTYAGTYQYVITVTMTLPEEQVRHMLATFHPAD